MYKPYYILAILIMLLFWVPEESYGFVESPPPVKDESMANWMEDIQQNMNVPSIPYTETNPNGSRQGKRGNLIYYYTTIDQYLAVCASAPTVWKFLRLETIP